MYGDSMVSPSLVVVDISIVKCLVLLYYQELIERQEGMQV